MICIVTSTHPPDDERIYFKQIKTLLKAQYSICYYTFWITNQNLSEKNLIHKNINPEDVSKNNFINLVLNSIISEDKIKSLHIHEFDLLPLIKKVKQKINLKTIYDVHEAHLEMWDTFSSKNYILKRLIKLFLWEYEKSKLKYIDQIITVTETLVKRYKKLHKNVNYLPNYPILIKDKLKVKKSQIIIYHGQLSEERGILDLLNAFMIIKKKQKSIKLYLAGASQKNVFLKTIKEFIIKNELQNDIIILGLIKYEKMIEILQDCLIGVIPFKNNKFTRMGLPVKLFEYMLTKCAVISVDFPIIKSHVKDSCLYFKSENIEDLSNKIIQLISDKKLYNQLINKAYDLVYNKYNWGELESDFIDIYKQ